MRLRPYEATADDPQRLSTFRCSTGLAVEDDVERWITTDARTWLNDVPRATYQQRQLGLIDDDAGALAAVIAWQDIADIPLEGIWLKALAVSLDHQHAGNGRAAYDITVDHLRTIDHEGDHIAGLVHVDNQRSKRLLASVGWTDVALWDDHELWVGSLR